MLSFQRSSGVPNGLCPSCFHTKPLFALPHPSHSSWYASCKLFYFTSYNFSSFYLILNGPKQLVLGRDRVVGTATHYGLGGPGIKSQWGRDFRTHPDQPWGPPSLRCNEYRVFFPGVKRQWRGVNHPPPNSAEVKEKVELYFYSPSGPS